MENWIDKIFSLKTFPGKLVFILWGASLTIVLLPDSSLSSLMLLEFKSSLSLWIGPTALVSSLVVLWMLGKYIFDIYSNRKFRKKWVDKVNEDMKNLNFNEVILLREFFFQNNDTILIPISEETVIALENKGFVYKAAQSAVVGHDMAFPFGINKYVKENISNEQLKLPKTNSFTEDEKFRLNEERPLWAKKILSRKQDRYGFSHW